MWDKTVTKEKYYFQIPTILPLINIPQIIIRHMQVHWWLWIVHRLRISVVSVTPGSHQHHCEVFYNAWFHIKPLWTSVYVNRTTVEQDHSRHLIGLTHHPVLNHCQPLVASEWESACGPSAPPAAASLEISQSASLHHSETGSLWLYRWSKKDIIYG